MASQIKPVPNNFNLVESIDDQKAKEVFVKYRFDQSAQELGNTYLTEIFKQVKIYVADVGYVDRLQSQLEKFHNFIKSLEEFDKCLEMLDRPRIRHRSDRESLFRIDQAGTQEFRRVMGRLFARFYSPESNIYRMLPYADFQEFETIHVGDRPLRPPIRPETERAFIGFRTEDFSEIITPSMIPPSRALLSCLKNATIAAIDELNAVTNSRGGQGRHPLELAIIQALVELWYKAFNGTKPIYANSANPDLLDFINEICALLGCPDLATEYAIKQVRPMVMERVVATNTR